MSDICLHKPSNMLMPTPENMVYALSKVCEDHGNSPWIPVALLTGFQFTEIPLGNCIADYSEQALIIGRERDFNDAPHTKWHLFAFEDNADGGVFGLILESWLDHYVGWDPCPDVMGHFHKRMRLEEWVEASKVPDPDAFNL